MERPELNQPLPRPPGMIGALRAGFDATASRIGVLFLPLVLDLAIWLGPRLRLEQLISPHLPGLVARTAGPYDAGQVLNAFQQMISSWNLLSLLRTFPVGVPSLMSWINVEQVTTAAAGNSAATPLGAPAVIQAGSALEVVAWGLGLILLGWLLGSLYLTAVARVSLGQAAGGARGAVQAFLLALLWAAIACILTLPLLVLLTVAMLINPLVAQALIYGLLFFGLWIILPVFFSPHAIFTRGQDALSSIATSLRLVRLSPAQTGFFLLSAFLLGQAFNLLWSVPQLDSWMMAVGITGHAFIATALLAASFIYYRDLDTWLETVLAQASAQAAMRQTNK